MNVSYWVSVWDNRVNCANLCVDNVAVNFIVPELDPTVEENIRNQKSSPNIIKLSAIRDVISSGKHALLDITPNAVERLNYAQMYPIVIFLKAETKMVVKQLRQGLPK